MEWPPGWEDADAELGAGFEAELARELLPGHPLYRLPVRAISQGGNGDDILFEITDGSGRVGSGRRRAPHLGDEVGTTAVARLGGV